MMRLLVRLALIVVAAGIVITGLGWLLPPGHQATVSASLPATPTEVFRYIAEVERYPEWRPDVSEVEMLEPAEGLRRFREHGEFGPIVFRIERVDAPTFMQTRIDDPTQPFGGTWTYALVPNEGGTLLTITEDGEVYNPLFRFLSRFVFSQTATMEAFVEDLRSALAAAR